MNYNYTACCWPPTSSNILILSSQFWQNQLWKLLIALRSAEYWCSYGIVFVIAIFIIILPPGLCIPVLHPIPTHYFLISSVAFTNMATEVFSSITITNFVMQVQWKRELCNISPQVHTDWLASKVLDESITYLMLSKTWTDLFHWENMQY